MSKYLVIQWKLWGLRFKIIDDTPKPQAMTMEEMVYHALMGDECPRGTKL